jgi:hypothetical protein
MTSVSTVEQQRLSAWASANSRLSRNVDASAVSLAHGPAGGLADATLDALRERVRLQGWVVYDAPEREPRAIVAEMCARFALGSADRTLSGPPDGLVELREARSGNTARYTPYSRRALGWHTDGYYNPPARAIRAFVLHCVRPARHGGANAMVDPRQVAKRLHALDSTILQALSTPDMMKIPANTEGSTLLRAEISIPVFAVADDGELVMRFTNRATHIQWRGGALFERARTALIEAIEAESALAPRILLKRGQGLLCNNVLHCREAFDDGDASVAPSSGRTLLRGRYLLPVAPYASERHTLPGVQG